MRLSEVLCRTGITARQLRYLVSEGFVPAPVGGRGRTGYGEKHVRAIDRYMSLKRMGISRSSIRILQRAREGVRFPTDSGITLVVPPDLVASGVPVESVLGPIERKVREILRMDDAGNAA